MAGEIVQAITLPAANLGSITYGLPAPLGIAPEHRARVEPESLQVQPPNQQMK